MRTAATATLAGIIGIAAGAAGWALLGPAKTSSDSKPAAVTSGTAHPGGAAHYASAQAIADKLTAGGFTVSMLHKSDVDPSLGIDTSYDITITAKPGPAPGDSGINLFRNPKALTAWVGISQGFGGIAVVGDTWAVSLTTDTAAGVTSSKELAPRIAKALGGTVEQ